MNEEVIARMRDRIRRTRRVIELAHNPEMVALLQAMVEEAEADIRRLERETNGPVDDQESPSRVPSDRGPKAPSGGH
jgi:hypothetical protein